MTNSLRAASKKGLWLGLMGIVIFSVTLPLTPLPVGTPDAPQMAGLFIAMGQDTVFIGKKMPVGTSRYRS